MPDFEKTNCTHCPIFTETIDEILADLKNEPPTEYLVAYA